MGYANKAYKGEWTYVVAPVDGRVVGAGDATTGSRAGRVGRFAGDPHEVIRTIDDAVRVASGPSVEVAEVGALVVVRRQRFGVLGECHGVDGLIDCVGGGGGGVDLRDVVEHILFGALDRDVAA